jgi:hypothetical protein
MALLYCRKANWCLSVPTEFSGELGGEERFNVPIAITACRIEGEVSHACSISRVHKSAEKEEDNWCEVRLQNV